MLKTAVNSTLNIGLDLGNNVLVCVYSNKMVLKYLC